MNGLAVSTRDVLHGLVLGLQHALFGVFSVSRLDSRWAPDDASLSQKVVEDIRSFTTLALRRNQQGKGQRSAPPASQSRPKIIQRLAQCSLLNGGVFLFSLLFFQHALLPGLEYILSLLFKVHSKSIWIWLHPLLSYTFSILWVVPVFVLSRVVNCFWFQDIADQAYRHYRGRPQALQSISRILADNLFSFVVQTVFLVQSQLVCLFPVAPFGQVIGFLHLALLNSLYTFEYQWYNMGWELHQRLHYIEENWPYFVGYGMPLALVSILPRSHLVSCCLFALLFPLFIVAGHTVGTPPRSLRQRRLQLFSPSVYVSNVLFHRFVSNQPVVCTTGGKSSSSSLAHNTKKKLLQQQQQQQQLHYR